MLAAISTPFDATFPAISSDAFCLMVKRDLSFCAFGVFQPFVALFARGTFLPAFFSCRLLLAGRVFT